MKLSRMVADLDVVLWAKGRDPSDSDPTVRGLSYDSRTTAPGDLFIAWKGQRSDGRQFARQAVESGAVAVLAWSEPIDDEELSVPWLVTPAPRALMGEISARLLDHPDRKLTMVGITGTNGKTSTALITQRMLERSGRMTGCIGTLGSSFHDLRFESARTTPEASDLFANLRSMLDAGAEAVVMEVSSHGLTQGRVTAVSYDVAAFTNLTRDHLDFHADFEDYYRAKMRLFGLLKPNGRAVINVDDEWGARAASELPQAITVGAAGRISPETVEIDERGIRGTLKTPRGPIEIETALLGRINLENLMVAVGIGEALELPHDGMVRAIAEMVPVPGRLEPVDCGQSFPVLIDYAHTDAGLREVLTTVKELSERKIAVVFGCGGDRDAGKRPLMGRVAGELADLPIVTNDNPRSEDPQVINAAVETGLKDSGNRKYKIIPDRREAIHKAIKVAGKRQNWCVVVAGKGNEEVQIIGQEVRPFSDREEVRRALEEVLGSAASG